MDGCSLRSSASDRVYYFYYIFIIHVQRPGTNVFPSRPESFPSGGGGRAGSARGASRAGWEIYFGLNTNKSTVAKPCVRRVLSAEFIASAGARSPGWAVAGAAPLPTLRARLGQRFERGSLGGESSRRLWRSGEGRGLCRAAPSASRSCRGRSGAGLGGALGAAPCPARPRFAARGGAGAARASLSRCAPGRRDGERKRWRRRAGTGLEEPPPPLPWAGPCLALAAPPGSAPVVRVPAARARQGAVPRIASPAPARCLGVARR